MLKSRRKDNSVGPTEGQVQKMIFDWAEKTGNPYLKMLNASQTGMRASSIAQAVNASRQGMKKGFPDISLPVPRGSYHGLYIELKKDKGGVVSPEQKGWLESLRNMGYSAEVARGFDEAVTLIMWYLSLDKTPEESITLALACSCSVMRSKIKGSLDWPKVRPLAIVSTFPLTEQRLVCYLESLGFNPYPEKGSE